MYKKANPKSLVLIFVMSFSLILLAGAAQPQKNQGSSDSQPSYIDELITNSPLTQSQADNMKNDGKAWGIIRIEARMAEQIAANNSDSEKTTEQKYQEALSYVLQQRTAGKGYGDIANENNIRLGSVIRNGNGAQSQQRDQTQLQTQTQTQERTQQRSQTQERNQKRLENQDGDGTQVKEQNRNREQTQVQKQTQTKTKKKGLLGRFFGLFSKEKKEQKQETSSNTQTNNSSNKVKTQQNVSNKVQTQNSSSSQRVQTQQRTQTTQRTQTQTRNGNSRGGGGRGR